MAWAFNDAIDTGFDWSEIGTLRILEKAGWERLYAGYCDYSPPSVGLETVANPTFVSQFNVGDDIQYVANLSILSIQNWAHASDWGAWFPIGFSIASRNPTVDSVGEIFTDFSYDDPYTPYQLNLHKALILAGYGDPDFTDYRRQMPRTVDSDSSAMDQNSNPAAIGQTALVMSFADGSSPGQIRQFDGAAWSIIPPIDTIPDTLDSHYGNNWANLSDPPSDARQCFPSAVGTIGEFLSNLWIFKQSRDVAKQYKILGRFLIDDLASPLAGSLGFGFDSESANVYNTTDGSDASMAAAIADVEALWPGDASTDYVPWRVNRAFSSEFGGYIANASAGDAKYQLRNFLGRPKSVEMYAVVSIPGDGSPEYVFSDQGEGVSLTAYNPIYSSGEQSDEFSTSPAWPTQLLAIPPDWPSGPPIPPGTYWEGFEAREFAALVTWNFEYQ